MTTEKKERTGTEYVVLGVKNPSETPPWYSRVGAITASNDTAAISALLGDDPSPGKYIAVPKRSFREREVTVSTVTQAKVS